MKKKPGWIGSSFVGIIISHEISIPLRQHARDAPRSVAQSSWRFTIRICRVMLVGSLHIWNDKSTRRGMSWWMVPWTFQAILLWCGTGGGKGENGMKKLSLKIEGPGKKRFCLANIKVSWHEKLLDWKSFLIRWGSHPSIWEAGMRDWSLMARCEWRWMHQNLNQQRGTWPIGRWWCSTTKWHANMANKLNQAWCWTKKDSCDSKIIWGKLWNLIWCLKRIYSYQKADWTCTSYLRILNTGNVLE